VREYDDYLLYAVSAWRQMSWQNFKKVFDALCLRYAAGGSHENGSARHFAWQSLRTLDYLGHADAVFDSNQSTVFAAPAVLCRLPVSGFPQAVLCGARSPGTRAALEEARRGLPCTLSCDGHPARPSGCFIPARIAVESETEDALSQLASRIRVGLSPVPPACVLLEYSGASEDYALSRPTVQAPEMDWPRLDFDTEALHFRLPGSGSPVVRLSKYQHPARGTILYRLWRGSTFQNVDRDWGRYLALRECGRNVLAYDARHFLLAVPATVPLPKLLARACTLCSGCVPLHTARGRNPPGLPAPCSYEVFSAVPPDIAAAVAAKVGQKLLRVTLDCFLEG
jgi:hypothetical protein